MNVKTKMYVEMVFVVTQLGLLLVDVKKDIRQNWILVPLVLMKMNVRWVLTDAI